MDFELFQYAFFFAVIAVLYVIGNTYERPESISQDLKEKFGLVSDQEKLTNHYEAMSSSDARRRTILRV